MGGCHGRDLGLDPWSLQSIMVMAQGCKGVYELLHDHSPYPTTCHVWRLVRILQKLPLQGSAEVNPILNFVVCEKIMDVGFK